MVPLRLSVEGLYSYRDTVEIDFTALTAARLFGIFGAVGSGKSALLEAMTLALYGESARLNAHDRRSYNLLNLQRDRLFILFEFRNHDGLDYQFTVEVRRRASDHAATGTMTRRAFRRSAVEEEGAWIPLESTDGALVTGLTYENFRRTTIIPQGQFQEFLQLGAADRTRMLKELFDLDRFDLQEPAARLLAATQQELDASEAAARELELADGVTFEERLGELTEELLRARDERTALSESLRTTRTQIDELTRHAELLRQRQHNAVELAQLAGQASRIDALERRVALIEQVRDAIAPLRMARDLAQARRGEAEQRLADAEAAVARIEGERVAAVAREAAAARLRDTVPELEQEIAARELLLELVPMERDLRERTVARDAAAAELQTIDGTIAEYEVQRAAIAAELPSSEELREMDRRWETLQRARRAEEQLERERAAILAKIECETTDTATVPVAVIEERDALAQWEHDVLLHRHIEGLAAELTPGAPCPLCGSLDHPAPAVSAAAAASRPAGAAAATESVAAASESATESAAAATESVAAAATTESVAEADPTSAARHARREMLDSAIHALELLEARRRERIAGGDGAGGSSAGDSVSAGSLAAPVDPTPFWQRHSEQERLQAELTRLQAQRSEQAAVQIRAAGEVDAIQHRIEERRTRLATLLPEDRRAQLEMDPPLARENGSDGLASARMVIDELIQRVQTATTDHEAARAHLESVTASAVAASSVRNERAAAHETADRELRESDDAYRTALATCAEPLRSMSDAEIGELVAARDELAELSAAVRAYHTDRERIEREIASIDAQLAARMVPVTDIGAINDELSRAREAARTAELRLQTSDQRVGELTREHADVAKRSERHRELAARSAEYTVRRDNLRTLARIFKGAGFVQYVASVYLAQLVERANVRFQRLTRNQLALALRGDHEFEVVDYLHGGFRRSIKTLSGGQTFQAALCLAIALVDSIDHGHARDGRQPGFFFLDEGFGSLDPAALQDVFATLTDLRRENRIVGIISHVEALQQEIDTFITVRNDSERGSLITVG